MYVQWNLDNPTLFGGTMHVGLQRWLDYEDFIVYVACSEGCVSECGQIVKNVEL